MWCPVWGEIIVQFVLYPQGEPGVGHRGPVGQAGPPGPKVTFGLRYLELKQITHFFIKIECVVFNVCFNPFHNSPYDLKERNRSTSKDLTLLFSFPWPGWTRCTWTSRSSGHPGYPWQPWNPRFPWATRASRQPRGARQRGEGQLHSMLWTLP